MQQRRWLSRLRQLISLIMVLGTIAVVTYADALPLAGRSQRQILQELDIWFRPNTLTLLLWLPVFAGLIAYATYQLMPRQTGNGLHSRLFLWLLVACGGQCAWVYFWHLGDLQWALVAIIVQLEGLMAAYVRLGIGRIRVRRNESICVRMPISLYLGWTSILTTLTLTAFLTTVTWDPFPLNNESWLLIVITLLSVLIGFVTMRHRDFVLALIVIAGLVGLAIEHRTNLTIVLAVAIMSVAMLLATAAMPTDQRPTTLSSQRR